MRMKAERTVDRVSVASAYEECVRELKEKLWEGVWRDEIEIPTQAKVEVCEDGKVKVTVKLIENGSEN